MKKGELSGTLNSETMSLSKEPTTKDLKQFCLQIAASINITENSQEKGKTVLELAIEYYNWINQE